jgi:hypothetical protein
MQAIWEKIYTLSAMPFRLAIFIFRGPDKGKGRLAGRYTRPGKTTDFEPSADYLIG